MDIHLHVGVSGSGKTTHIRKIYLDQAHVTRFVPGDGTIFPRTLLKRDDGVHEERLALAGSYEETPVRDKRTEGTDCFRRAYGANHIFLYALMNPDEVDVLVMDGYKIYSVQLLKRLRDIPGVSVRVTHYKCPQHVAFSRTVERGDPPAERIHQQKYRIAEGFANYCRSQGLPITEVATWHQ